MFPELQQLVASLLEKFALQPEKSVLQSEKPENPILPWTLTPEQPPHGALKLETSCSSSFFSVPDLDPADYAFLLRLQRWGHLAHLDALSLRLPSALLK
jgi:hypothetical protein